MLTGFSDELDVPCPFSKPVSASGSSFQVNNSRDQKAPIPTKAPGRHFPIKRISGCVHVGTRNRDGSPTL